MGNNSCCTNNEQMNSAVATMLNLKCTTCGGEISADVPFRQCPRCLLGLGLSREITESDCDASSTAFPEGKTEFDFEILEPLGRGGMGFVYRAWQRSLNRMVALKRIRMGELASPAALGRFRREAELAAKLVHPNIVSIYQIGEYEANPYLVMRLVEGASLAERLHDFVLPSKRTESACAQMRISRFMAVVARAVHYAHERGVLHRDLKPSNILLDLDEIPHLTDFGIAKLLEQETNLTQTAELLGTPSYMAPEQAAGKAISRGADIYSLGAILYELLGGRPPFEGQKPMEILRRVMEQEPLHPSVLNPAVDRGLATICLKCLDKDPMRRYGSALELAEDLERWQRHEPISARDIGALLRLRRWSVRNPAISTLLLMLTIGMAVTLGLLGKANEEKSRKSIALDILRTESARQLQEIWSSANAFFEIKSETLAAMAGMEVTHLTHGEHRFTIALVSQGNPLERVLRAAPMLNRLERAMSALAEQPTRLDLRLSKNYSGTIEDLVKGEIDFVRISPRNFLRARDRDPTIQSLIAILPTPGHNDSAVIFTSQNTGIKSLAELRGKSFLLSGAESTLSFWTKVSLVDSGIASRDLSKYRYIDRTNDLSPEGKSMPAILIGNPFSPMTPVQAVTAGKYDAAVVGEKRFREVAVEQQLVALHRFQEVGDLLAARGNLPPEAARRFQRAMLSLQDSPSHQTFFDAPARMRASTENDVQETLNKLAAEASFAP
jgi:serine/threonine protein kinase